MSEHYLVITSWPTAEGAHAQARIWLENKLAASVNVLAEMDSIYYWKGEIRHGTEHKIFIKTSRRRLDQLCRTIREAHPYEVAEILQFAIDSGDPDYLDWISRSTR